jgi:hypothetical protein
MIGDALHRKYYAKQTQTQNDHEAVLLSATNTDYPCRRP